MLVEGERSAGIFDAVAATGLDVPVGTAPVPRRMSWGPFNGQWLYLTYFGGDGNDLSLYTALVPGDTDGDGDLDDADPGRMFSADTGPIGSAGGKTPPTASALLLGLGGLA